ncbi:CRAL-TRIO domain-containing protein [Gymnopilus junonius]|uniref:CRAL-TRIO domain-containing protein n=1 Tax=Gymnopilus junonius TaxID=109634 RepID=A0A9P5NQI3_GYMJU|nr:CRAL-TRIO domain-containing protein [Gymnopilus junonius]
METRKRLQKNRDALLEQYHTNLDDVYNLQDTLIRDVLPSVTDELELGPEAQEWAKEWLSDTSSIFRISRRHKFTRSFSLEAIQRTLLWRLDNLWPIESPISIPNLHCLPSNIRDPFGRPILVLEVNPVDVTQDLLKRFLIRAFEQLRLHLKKLYDDSEDNLRPPLQYIALFDLSQLSFQSINIDLFTWSLREVIPRFPGMIAGVFVLNYSWTHSGFWSILKRLLPESALSRVFFPSKEELINFFSPTALPQDYGGDLSRLSLLEDPMNPRMHPAKLEVTCLPSTPSSAPPPRTISWLSPTSILNPFFGYPVSTSSTRGPPSFRHGRRRKRDLVRTLLTLFWIRWRKHITFGLCLTIILVIWRLSFARITLRFPKGNFMLRWFMSSRGPIQPKLT